MIDLAVASGAYQNPGEVSIRPLRSTASSSSLEDWMLEQRASVNAHIEQGFTHERGELIGGDVAIAMLRKGRA